jgi:predicted metal-dependent hydrolase
MDAGEHRDNFDRGIEQFNTRRFFDAHETWEEIWLQSPEPQKTFLQGIIQVSAAFHHYLRGNHKGACSLLNAGLGRLGQFPGIYGGIELDSLRPVAQHWADSLAGGRDPGAGLLPLICRAPGNERPK